MIWARDKSIWLNKNDLLNCWCRAPSSCDTRVFRDAFVSSVNSQRDLSVFLSLCLPLSLFSFSVDSISGCFSKGGYFSQPQHMQPEQAYYHPHLLPKTRKKKSKWKLGQDCEKPKQPSFWQCGSFAIFPCGCVAQRKQGHNGHRVQWGGGSSRSQGSAGGARRSAAS